MPFKVDSISFTYNKKTNLAFKALDNVSFNIEENKITCIVGETGCGKTTLIQTFNALLMPDEGKIEILDFVLNNKKNKHIKELRKNVGLVFQFPEAQLFEETVIKDVMFGLKNFGIKEEEKKSLAMESLKLMGISKDMFERSPFDLSGGERRRVALAGVLALKPKVLVLDEPTVGLDPHGKKEILSTIVKLKDKYGMTVIIVTHDNDVIFEYADNVIALDHGKKIFDGSREEFLLSDSVKSFTKPNILLFIEELKKNGINIPFSNIRNLEDLTSYIKEHFHE